VIPAAGGAGGGCTGIFDDVEVDAEAEAGGAALRLEREERVRFLESLLGLRIQAKGVSAIYHTWLDSSPLSLWR